MRLYLSCVIFCLLAYTGCSGSNPVTPSSSVNSDSSPDSISTSKQISSTGIMGPYELTINTINGTADLVPKRLVSIGESYIVSGESFFVTQPCSDCLVINGIGIENDLVIVQLGIRHPFEEGNPAEPPTGKNRLDLDIFDAALVVFPIGETPTHYNLTDADVYDDILHEQHGFTTELANITGDPAAMPYILVVDDSDPLNPGNTFNEFAMGASDDIEFLIDIASGTTLQFDLYLTFGYGFSATFLDRLDPQYFNPEYNRKAPWKVEVAPMGKWLTFDSTTPTYVEIKVYDWQIGANVDSSLTNPTDIYAASEIQQISVEIPGMNSMLPVISGDQYIHGSGFPNDPLIYQIPIVNENSISAGMYTGLVKVTDERVPQQPSTGRDFLIDSPDGKTLSQYEMTEYATYQTFTAEVTSTLELNPVDVTPPWLYFYPIDICVNGNYAYTAGELHGINIFDISDPLNPYWIKKVEVAGYAVSVFTTGEYLYVADEDGLVIIDISEPEFAAIVGAVTTTDDALDVYVDGIYAYVADEEDGLQIINIADPTNPVISNTVDTDGYATGVCVSGNYAYVADYDYGLQIIDVSIPGSASIVNTVATNYDAYAVSIKGDYAYVATDDELEIIDIFPASSAASVNTLSFDDPRNIYISGDLAYVADDENGLQVVDISSPGFETVEKTIDTPNYAIGVDGSDGYVYIVDYRSSLHVIDIDPLTSADIVATINTIQSAYDVEIDSDYAYVNDNYLGLFIFDISTPGNAHIVGSEILPGHSYDCAVSGDYVYTAAGSDGMYIINVSDRTTPSFVSTYNTISEVRALHVKDDFLNVAAGANGFYLVDISTPTSPAISSSIGLPGNALAVDALGDYACVGTTSGVQIVDISIPAAVVLAGSAATGNDRGVSMNSDYAFVGDFDGTFTIVDYDPPDSASIESNIAMPGTSRGSTFFQGYCFLANSTQDLVIIDVDPPASAFIEDTLELLGPSNNVKVSNGFAFVACSSGGLRIVDLW